MINRIAKGFANVVMTQDWHTAGHISFASTHPGKKPFEMIDLPYGKQVLWPDHCVQGTDGAALSKDLSIPQAGLVIRKGFHKDVDSYSAFTEADGKTTTASPPISRRARCSACSWPGSRPISVSRGRRSMRARPDSRPMWSKMPAAASTPGLDGQGLGRYGEGRRQAHPVRRYRGLKSFSARENDSLFVMPGLVPGIHVLPHLIQERRG